MIVSVSRRTDIPALYAEWFFNRLQKGHVHTKNPFNRKQVRNVSLAEEDVDGFVFWTRNPKPFWENIDRLRGYAYYFQVTLTPYGKDLEPASVDKDAIVETLKKMARDIGKARIIWRYDPVLLNDKYTENWHYERFEAFANALKESVDEVVVSFLNTYRKNKKALEKANVQTPKAATKLRMAKTFARIAGQQGIRIGFCGEGELHAEGLPKAQCVDEERLSKLSGKPLVYKKDPNQRADCTCAKSVDIGVYDTCTFGCRYCYATVNQERASQNRKRHQKASSFLLGRLEGDETITPLPRKPKGLF